MNKNERMETLKVNGMDVGKYFDVTLPNGDVLKMTLENGVPVVANDPIMEQIIEDGYVRNTRLHRRFVMAQMFRMLNYKKTETCTNPYGYTHTWLKEGFDECLENCFSYKYQFDMMLEEIRVISKLEERDIEAFLERTAFFNKNVVIITCEDYMVKLKEYIGNLPVYKCKGVPYKKLNKYENVFESDLQKKVYNPLECQIKRMAGAKCYHDLYLMFHSFVKSMVKLPGNIKKCKTWVDAYKGSGAYFTLKNMTMYHDCKIVDVKRGDYVRNPVTGRYGRTADIETEYKAGAQATDFVKSKLNEYKGEGWRYMAMLRKCIADNKFDFNERMAEIYKK